MRLRETLGAELSAALMLCFAVLIAYRPTLPLPDHGPHPAADIPTADGTVHGIDVSHYQGDINWTRVAATGVGFAYGKASEGITYIDPRFGANKVAAMAAGLPFGAFHFYQPNDPPIPQAQNFLTAAAIGPGSLPPVLDLERAPAKGSEAAFAKDVQTWLDYVQQSTGCAPIIYAGPAFWNSYLQNAPTDQQLWLASYGNSPHLPDNKPNWTFWQRSAHGNVAGISGYVDMDIFQGTATDLTNLTCK